MTAERARKPPSNPHPARPEMDAERARRAGRRTRHRGRGTVAPTRPKEQPRTSAPCCRRPGGAPQDYPLNDRSLTCGPHYNFDDGLSPGESRRYGAGSPLGRKVRETWFAQGIHPSANQSSGTRGCLDGRALRSCRTTFWISAVRPQQAGKFSADGRLLPLARRKGRNRSRPPRSGSGAPRSVAMGGGPYPRGPQACCQQ
jgi:hypothetical protein